MCMDLPQRAALTTVSDRSLLDTYRNSAATRMHFSHAFLTGKADE